MWNRIVTWGYLLQPTAYADDVGYWAIRHHKYVHRATSLDIPTSCYVGWHTYIASFTYNPSITVVNYQSLNVDFQHVFMYGAAVWKCVVMLRARRHRCDARNASAALHACHADVLLAAVIYSLCYDNEALRVNTPFILLRQAEYLRNF